MFLIHLLFALLVLVALILELVTPLILNIPLIAFCLAILILTIWFFKRARRQKKIPLIASAALGVQAIFFLLSIAIFAVITIPNERAEDSPAVVQGIRQFLVSQGLIAKPRVVVQPAATPEESKPPETINAPEAGKVDIKIE